MLTPHFQIHSAVYDLVKLKLRALDKWQWIALNAFFQIRNGI